MVSYSSEQSYSSSSSFQWYRVWPSLLKIVAMVRMGPMSKIWAMLESAAGFMDLMMIPKTIGIVTESDWAMFEQLMYKFSE